MANLDVYNKLPPRPEYLAAVTTALKANAELSLYELAKKSGLTKTQAGCALTKLLNDDIVAGSGKPVKYRLIPTNEKMAD